MCASNQTPKSRHAILVCNLKAGRRPWREKQLGLDYFNSRMANSYRNVVFGLLICLITLIRSSWVLFCNLKLYDGKYLYSSPLEKCLTIYNVPCESMLTKMSLLCQKCFAPLKKNINFVWSNGLALHEIEVKSSVFK